MPQGPTELQEKWGDDWTALKFLKERGINHVSGVFQLPKDRVFTDEENSALDYLWLEWDYASVVVEEN